MASGRKKVEIKKIEKKQSRLVTFSKRRNGLFGKAAQLCSMSAGAHIAVIVFSPHGRPYAFGHPSADSVIGRFLSRSDSATASDGPVNKGREAEPEGALGLDASWLDMPIENMGLDELEWYNALLKELRERVATRVDEMEKRRMATREYFPLHPVIG